MITSSENRAARAVAIILALVASVVFPIVGGAQTIRTDATRLDTILHIVKAGGTTFDSAKVERSYNGATLVRWVKANATDTARFAKATSTTARIDSVRVRYSTLAKPKLSATAVAARIVAPPPVVTPPVVTPPVTQPTTGSYAIPAPPLTFTPVDPVVNKTVAVANGGDLQAALNAATAGTEVVMANGSAFVGNYVYSGRGAIALRCATVPTGKVGPNNVPTCRIESPNSEAALRTGAGASQLRITGVEFASNVNENYGIVVLGRGDETTLAAMPTDITLDRVWVHSSATGQTRRCVAFNGIRLALTNSLLTECHSKGFDTQGVGGWNGPGPFLIANNRIEASGQAIMFGGADPRIPNVSPSDITITGNSLYKPLSWGDGRWTVKAVFELKHAKRVLFEGNTIENHWAHAQNGCAFLFQVLSDNNTAWAWTTIADVTVRNNVIRNATCGANIAARVAYNGPLPTNPLSRLAITNNLFENVGRDPITGNGGIGVQLLSDLIDVTISNNTFTLASGSAQKMLSFDGTAQTRTRITDNVFVASGYPITGNSTGPGKATLDVFMPGGVFRNNSLPGARVQDFGIGALGNAVGANMAAIAGVVR